MMKTHSRTAVRVRINPFRAFIFATVWQVHMVTCSMSFEGIYEVLARNGLPSPKALTVLLKVPYQHWQMLLRRRKDFWPCPISNVNKIVQTETNDDFTYGMHLCSR